MASKLQLASIALFGASIGAASAVAQVPQTPTTEQSIIVTHKLVPSPDLIVRTVFIGDLDLKSVAGQKLMEKRVNDAVEEMCAVPNPIPTQGRNMSRPCRDEAWASARPQMDQAIKRASGS